LDNKSFFEDVKKETKTAILKVFSNIEEISKVSTIKLQISNLRGQIRDNKLEIGDFATSKIQKFSKFQEIQLKIDKINLLQSKVEVIDKNL